MSESEARRTALLAFGGRQNFREATSDARGVAAVDNLMRDTRFALRRLHRAPGFTLAVIATLGIGIGAAVGIGSIVYDVLLRDLRYEKPDQLVRVDFLTEGMATTSQLHSSATYYHFVKSARSFAALGAYSTSDAFAVTDGDAAERVTVALMSPNTLTLLGARPILGHLFAPGDTSWYARSDGSLLPILISENLWRRRYGADPSVIGRRIDIDHGERAVIGVLPRSFAFPTASVDIFYPAPVPVKQPDITSRYFTVIGRLREGVSASSAEAELNALIPALTERFPAITPDMLRQSRAHVAVKSLKAVTVASVRPQLVLLGLLVAVVLLIATTNIVNLFVLRTERASREIAIALALGASRVALAQRFLVEGVVLGLASSTVAIPVAVLALSTKFGFTAREIPRLEEVSFTAQTAALVLGCAVLVSGTVALIALTHTRLVGLFDRLRSLQSTSSRAWRRAQNGLVALQVATALVLLIAAGLLGRSFWNLRNARIGFVPENAMTFQLSLPFGTVYTTYDEQAAFHAKVLDRLAALPGVSGVGVTLRVPLASRAAQNLEMRLQAGDDDGRPLIASASNMASPDYFHVMGIPLRSGRTFRAGDLRGTPAVIVSEQLAANVFGTTNVVGRGIKESPRLGAPSALFTIIGVVGDVQWERIEDGYAPMIYFPILRDGDGLPASSTSIAMRPRDVQFVIRGAPLPSVATIQRIVKEIDPRVPATTVRTLDSVVDDATARVRLTMLLISIAGVAALLLGVIGVYSVVSYAANSRAREFGIRLALGASPARVGGMVLRNGLRLLTFGTGSGLVAAFGAMRFLRVLLYEVEPTSVAEFGLATTVLVVVTLCAMLLPARRAAHTQAAAVLRGE